MSYTITICRTRFGLGKDEPLYVLYQYKACWAVVCKTMARRQQSGQPKTNILEPALRSLHAASIWLVARKVSGYAQEIKLTLSAGSNFERQKYSTSLAFALEEMSLSATNLFLLGLDVIDCL